MDAKLVLGVAIIGAFLISETYDQAIYGVVSESDHSSDLTQEQLSILSGEDPTDILPETAAGEEVQKACRSGRIDAGTKAHSLDQQMYVSFKEGGMNYILIKTSPESQLFLQQDSFQVTTADVIKPEEKIREQLGEYLKNRDSCVIADLYLSRVKRS